MTIKAKEDSRLAIRSIAEDSRSLANRFLTIQEDEAAAHCFEVSQWLETAAKTLAGEDSNE
jgi:hypothetical protein